MRVVLDFTPATKEPDNHGWYQVLLPTNRIASAYFGRPPGAASANWFSSDKYDALPVMVSAWAHQIDLRTDETVVMSARVFALCAASAGMTAVQFQTFLSKPSPVSVEGRFINLLLARCATDAEIERLTANLGQITSVGQV